jgi:hypothetical protein
MAEILDGAHDAFRPGTSAPNAFLTIVRLGFTSIRPFIGLYTNML